MWLLLGLVTCACNYMLKMPQYLESSLTILFSWSQEFEKNNETKFKRRMKLSFDLNWLFLFFLFTVCLCCFSEHVSFHGLQIWYCGGSFRARNDLGRGSKSHFPPALFFFSEVEIRLHTALPLIRPGSVHSDSTKWDSCGWAFTDQLCLSLSVWGCYCLV